MLKKTALALAGLLALASAPAMAASCSGVNCYKMNDGSGALQSVKAITLGDGTVIQQTIPSDATGTPYSSGNQPPLPTGAATSANQVPPQTAGAALSGTTGMRTMGSDGTNARDLSLTTSGALQPATAASGKITRTSTSLTANTSTTLAVANANRIAVGVQCASGAVSVDETGGTLTAAGVGNGTLFMPAGTAPYWIPPVATRTAITAYSATAQACVVTEYNQ